ncbi:GNAT family N-acetyltransferase (plasmid) [Cereibacter azotoformans]|uniref:GNAT family N-acetyltransferase n=1 Tax=Cereibacter azotoformans TaxID=43057 RepID=UPI000E359BB0|nr:GNAT family N-acetyltransferase [Cereibacter azotoformans]AXQ95983.1 GNAT family N-acetyltransferase [Cereibacter sphaeroides]UIJ33052.1 GNAT family N-acetyltransferase [Cereibacter azotoformans]
MPTDADLDIRRDNPTDPAFAPLFERHLTLMWATSPPESVHALDPADLAVPGVRFYGMRRAGLLVGMGAFKAIDATHAEIKSMHVLAETRGQGLAARLLAHLLAEARAAGFARMSLETGVEPAFAPARTLYARAGFAPCGPFEGYREDPNSLFMTRSL